MKNEITRALQTYQHKFPNMFNLTNFNHFKNSIADLLPGAENTAARNLLQYALEVDAFNRLKNSKGKTEEMEFAKLVTELTNKYVIQEQAASELIGCVAGLFGCKVQGMQKQKTENLKYCRCDELEKGDYCEYCVDAFFGWNNTSTNSATNYSNSQTNTNTNTNSNPDPFPQPDPAYYRVGRLPESALYYLSRRSEALSDLARLAQRLEECESYNEVKKHLPKPASEEEDHMITYFKDIRHPHAQMITKMLKENH